MPDAATRVLVAGVVRQVVSALVLEQCIDRHALQDAEIGAQPDDPRRVHRPDQLVLGKIRVRELVRVRDDHAVVGRELVALADAGAVARRDLLAVEIHRLGGVEAQIGARVPLEILAAQQRR